MKGRPLIPFAIIAIIGVVLMVALSAAGVNQRADREAEEAGEGDEGEEVVIDDPIAYGEETAMNSCISCHGGDLTGGMGPDLTSLDLSQEEIVDIILNGQGSMPAIDLQPEEADAVAQYLLEGIE
ncbi:cytochrome c550 [Shouchella shacheensis]|uniref:cytochrome c550 n=1 Tax=Shouchella shacheensis TaxID=1649580 RepID=UPI00073FAFB9|nr:cytochrome c [Shouchella shacheensis]